MERDGLVPAFDPSHNVEAAGFGAPCGLVDRLPGHRDFGGAPVGHRRRRRGGQLGGDAPLGHDVGGLHHVDDVQRSDGHADADRESRRGPLDGEGAAGGGVARGVDGVPCHRLFGRGPVGPGDGGGLREQRRGVDAVVDVKGGRGVRQRGGERGRGHRLDRHAAHHDAADREGDRRRALGDGREHAVRVDAHDAGVVRGPGRRLAGDGGGAVVGELIVDRPGCSRLEGDGRVDQAVKAACGHRRGRRGAVGRHGPRGGRVGAELDDDVGRPVGGRVRRGAERGEAGRHEVGVCGRRRVALVLRIGILLAMPGVEQGGRVRADGDDLAVRNGGAGARQGALDGPLLGGRLEAGRPREGGGVGLGAHVVDAVEHALGRTRVEGAADRHLNGAVGCRDGHRGGVVRRRPRRGEGDPAHGEGGPGEQRGGSQRDAVVQPVRLICHDTARPSLLARARRRLCGAAAFGRFCAKGPFGYLLVYVQSTLRPMHTPGCHSYARWIKQS